MSERFRGEREENGLSPALLSDPIVLWAVCALAGSVYPRNPVPALGIAILWFSVFVLSRRRSARFWAGVLALGLFFTCAERSARSVRDFSHDYQNTALRLLGPKRCALVGEVMTSPTLRSSDEPGKAPLLLFTVLAQEVDCEGTLFTEPLPIRLYGSGGPVARGDHISAIASLAPVQIFRNASLTDPVPGAARRGALLSGSALSFERERAGEGLKSHIDRFRERVRTRIMATYRPEIESLGRALVLGENDLPEGDAEAFQHSGLLHLLAVSGTHLVIAVLSLVGALSALLVRIELLARRFDTPRIASGLGALLAVLYADFSGGSGSAWRAAFMLVIVLLGRSLGFHVGGVSALGASVLIGLSLDPLAAADYSFLLSALATIGLIALGAPLSRRVSRKLPGSLVFAPLLTSLIATVASTVPCAPVLSLMSGEMTFAALAANVIAAPLGEIIALPACLLHTVMSGFPDIEQGLATLGSGALLGVREVALMSASIESAQFQLSYPSPTRLGLLVGGGVVLLSLLKPLLSLPRALGSVAISLLLAALLLLVEGPWRKNSQAHLSVTALDVGQGDALFIDFPDGKIGIIDGGGFVTGVPDTGARVLRPYLRARGRTKVDLVALSHAHPDHISGLLTLLPHVEVTELWIPHLPDRPGGALFELVALARKSGARITTAAELCAQTSHAPLSYGGVEIEVLSPCAPVTPPLSLNDDSLVFRLSHGRRRVLFTGDVERRGEALLLATQKNRLRADVLKVAHHGSDTSSNGAFLDAVAPEVGLISCGIRNRFEHPRPSTLTALAERGIEVHRTDHQGSITVRTDGASLEIRDSNTLPAWRKRSRESL